MKYYISDLHLFHENSIKFDERPFGSLDEMHETIKKRWNSKITNGDKVFILGDISYRDCLSFYIEGAKNTCEGKS